MKWDFFYDEDNGEPYQCMQDWHHEISHLVYPLIIMATIGTIVFLYFLFS